jgi:hypothetical protein
MRFDLIARAWRDMDESHEDVELWMAEIKGRQVLRPPSKVGFCRPSNNPANDRGNEQREIQRESL